MSNSWRLPQSSIGVWYGSIFQQSATSHQLSINTGKEEHIYSFNLDTHLHEQFDLSLRFSLPLVYPNILLKLFYISFAKMHSCLGIRFRVPTSINKPMIKFFTQMTRLVYSSIRSTRSRIVPLNRSNPPFTRSQHSQDQVPQKEVNGQTLVSHIVRFQSQPNQSPIEEHLQSWNSVKRSLL